MSLADAPVDKSFQITTPGGRKSNAAKYAVAGIAPGRHARVLARYPGNVPRFVEVELDGERLVTLPMAFAEQVVVEPIAAG